MGVFYNPFNINVLDDLFGPPFVCEPPGHMKSHNAKSSPVSQNRMLHGNAEAMHMRKIRFAT
ncbi:hypothetical protein BCAR13_1140019 [Paraburkholderia caribensis]|nr:hypothetical protein BCAR13_1140019 [Paraburkholderia caribensis]